MSKRKAASIEEEEDEEKVPDPIEADVMDRKCWLLRVPNDLAERWHVSQFRWGLYHEAKKRSSAQPSNLRLQEEVERKRKEAMNASSLGRIAIDYSTGRAVGKLEVPARVEGQQPETYQMQLEYNNERIGQKAPHLRILQETVERADGEEEAVTKLRVAAEVSDYWNVEENKNKWKNRNEALLTTKKGNNIVVEDEFDKGVEPVNNYIRPLQQHEIAAKSQAQVERRLQPEQRAERKDADLVSNELLTIFNESPFWTTRDLRDKTNQPEQFLKSILQGIAVLNERGPNRGKWQLKEDMGGPPLET